METNYSFLRRVQFGIYQRELLETALLRLKQETDDLISYSTRRFRRQGNLGDATNTSEQRSRVSSLTEMSTLAAALYHKSRQSRREWALDLRLPGTLVDQSTLWRIVEDKRLHFTINEPRVDPPNPEPSLQARVLLYPPRGTPNPSQESLSVIDIDDTLQDFKLTSLVVDDTSWRLHAEHSAHEVSLPWRARLHDPARSKIADEKYAVAIGATIWSILLWETEWISGLCSCRINRVTPEQQQRQTLNTMYHVLRPRTRSHLRVDKYILLGALHGETALEEPITMHKSKNGVKFLRQKDVEGIEIMELNKDDFLYEIMRIGDIELAEVVRYCFSHSEEHDQSFRLTLGKLVENVLNP